MKIKELTMDSFSAYGRFSSMVEPHGASIGDDPILFYRDLMPVPAFSPHMSFSVTEIRRREPVVDVLEFHSKTSECFLNLDGDGIFCVGTATNTGLPDFESLNLFYAPKGTLIYIYPGVWHHAPYCIEGDVLHSLVFLPERTYANDCVVYQIPEEERISF